jgi:hypothetical protein
MTDSGDSGALIGGRTAVTRERVEAIVEKAAEKIAASPEMAEIEPDPDKRLALVKSAMGRARDGGPAGGL